MTKIESAKEIIKQNGRCNRLICSECFNDGNECNSDHMVDRAKEYLKEHGVEAADTGIKIKRTVYEIGKTETAFLHDKNLIVVSRSFMNGLVALHFTPTLLDEFIQELQTIRIIKNQEAE